jgi:hypothetical protein
MIFEFMELGHADQSFIIPHLSNVSTKKRAEEAAAKESAEAERAR